MDTVKNAVFEQALFLYDPAGFNAVLRPNPERR